MLAMVPREKSSAMTTLAPEPTNRSVGCDPVNPAPPLTRIRSSSHVAAIDIQPTRRGIKIINLPPAARPLRDPVRILPLLWSKCELDSMSLIPVVAPLVGRNSGGVSGRGRRHHTDLGDGRRGGRWVPGRWERYRGVLVWPSAVAGPVQREGYVVNPSDTLPGGRVDPEVDRSPWTSPDDWPCCGDRGLLGFVVGERGHWGFGAAFAVGGTQVVDETIHSLFAEGTPSQRGHATRELDDRAHEFSSHVSI